MTTRKVYRNSGFLRMCNALAAGLAIVLTLVLSTAAHAAVIEVDSLADPHEDGKCTLHDAIISANTGTLPEDSNGQPGKCTAGQSPDTIQFSNVGGSITLADTLPPITDSNLTIQGPGFLGTPIGIDGGDKVQVMKLTSSATVTLSNVDIKGGRSAFLSGGGGGILNYGRLNVSNGTFYSNSAGTTVGAHGGGSIFNNAGETLTVTNSTFISNSATDTAAGGGIENRGDTER
jgi:hypothetical protein